MLLQEQELKKYIDHRTWNPEKVKELVGQGASPNLKNRFSNTLLAMAVIKKDKDLIKFLVESGADPDLPNNKGFTARKFANRNPSLKKALLSSGFYWQIFWQ